MMYNYLYGAQGGGMMLFGSLASLLVIIALILTIVALWKYINQK